MFKKSREMVEKYDWQKNVSKNQVHDNITSDLNRSFVDDIKKWILKTC